MVDKDLSLIGDCGANCVHHICPLMKKSGTFPPKGTVKCTHVAS